MKGPNCFFATTHRFGPYSPCPFPERYRKTSPGEIQPSLEHSRMEGSFSPYQENESKQKNHTPRKRRHEGVPYLACFPFISILS